MSPRIVSFAAPEIRPFYVLPTALPHLRHQIQHRHPHRQAVGDLLQNAALRPVSDVGLDFNSAVHGSGVHDENVRLTALKAITGQSKKTGKLAHARKLAGLDPLKLHAKHIDDIDLADDLIQVMHDPGAQLLEGSRAEGGGPDDDDLGAEFSQPPDIGSRDSAVGDVPDDGDGESFNFPEALANGVEIEQTLRRMLVSAVAGIDDCLLYTSDAADE